MDYPLCPYCRRPVWENQPQYEGWHLWCDQQTEPQEHQGAWLWHSSRFGVDAARRQWVAEHPRSGRWG